MLRSGCNDVELIEALDVLHIREGAIHRAKLAFIAEADRRELWRGSGCRDLAQWLSGRYHVSPYRARRLISAARAIESLPRMAAALEAGVLSIDKVVELCRFATEDTEKALISWSKRVSVGCIRSRADRYMRVAAQEAREAHQGRRASWWFYDDDAQWFYMEAFLPADMGRMVASAIEAAAEGLPHDPDATYDESTDQRRADALVALCSGTPSGEVGERAPATIVVHTPIAALLHDGPGSTIEGAGALHPDVVCELTCDSRLQVVLEDEDGNALGIGHTSRKIPPWLRRQVLRRDHGCTFPGCGTRRFIDIHHVVRWPKGPTDLNNLTALCNFHHKLVHRHGWRIEVVRDGARWFRPDGSAFLPGPSPPRDCEPLELAS
ncbi:MAG: HNH endonuclease [Actinomycetota bacterium]|nr:HNH endonuclease [Actinomycetota bacterium]